MGMMEWLEKKSKKKYSKPSPTVQERKKRIADNKAKGDKARLETSKKKRDEAKKSGKVGKQKRAQNKINKASGSKVKHTKASIKKANKADKSWSKASKSAKASGTSISSLVKKRKGLKKGTAEYAKVQNQINKHYGSKVKHKAPEKSSGVGRLDRDKVAGKVEDLKRPVKITAKTDARKTKPDAEKDAYGKGEEKKIKEEMSTKYKDGGMVNDMRPQYGHGGKVEGGGLFSFPSKDARKR